MFSFLKSKKKDGRFTEYLLMRFFKSGEYGLYFKEKNYIVFFSTNSPKDLKDLKDLKDACQIIDQARERTIILC